MRQYCIYSFVAHFIAFIAFGLFVKNAVIEQKKEMFTVDFIASAPTQSYEQSAPAPAKQIAAKEIKTAKPKAVKVSKPAEIIKPSVKQSAPKEVKEEKIVLGTPSMAAELKEKDADKPADIQNDSAPIATDFQNFPYPWYITRVRAELWSSWAQKMPSAGKNSAVIFFIIQNDGKVKDVKVERSSGNKLFDFAAMSAAEQAGPFAKLPADYKEKELKVFVEFKTEQ